LLREHNGIEQFAGALDCFDKFVRTVRTVSATDHHPSPYGLRVAYPAPDIVDMRDMLIEMYGLTNLDGNYTIYHDESNNIRLLRLTDEGFNIDKPDCFILGGICYKGSERQLKLEVLKTKLELQKSVQDMKLKHLSKGAFPQLLESKKISIFLQWLLDEDLLIHFSVMDVVYWSITDIIDSILTEINAPQLFNHHRELKNDLYITLRMDFKKPLELFIRHTYPNVGREGRNQFLLELIKLIIERRDLLPEFNYRMLRGVLEMATKLVSLPYLENEEPNILINSFSVLYHHQLILFKGSSHIFDIEEKIKNSLTSIALSDNQQPLQNYRFAESSNEEGIQISDVFIGLLGKCFSFINQNSVPQIMTAKSDFSETQRNNLRMLKSLIDRSICECPAFAHYTISNEDMYRADILFKE